ncbi:hypothetical protein [Sporomusa acidovorans]|nr:hypothetical protein [Sporomusa acidovorans]
MLVITFITAIVLLVIFNMLGVKSDNRPGARSGQLRAMRQLRRWKKGKWF